MSRHIICHDYRGIPIVYAEIFVVTKFCVTKIVIQFHNFWGFKFLRAEFYFASQLQCVFIIFKGLWLSFELFCAYLQWWHLDFCVIQLFEAKFEVTMYPRIFGSLLMEKYYSVIQRETSNHHDPFAVAILKDGIVVGHMPRKISHYSWEDTKLFNVIRKRSRV